MDGLWPLLTCAQAAEHERALLTTEEAEWAAMRRAGASLAQAVRHDFAWWRPWPTGARLCVLAGKGHNAGDALLAAAALCGRDGGSVAEVTVLWVFGRGGLKPLAERSRQELFRVAGDRVRELDWTARAVQGLDARAFDLTLDGIVGMQFAGGWRGAGAEAVEWANAAGARLGLRVAADLPSGLADTPGDPVLWADVTYATGIAKTPLFSDAGLATAGRVRLLDLGFFPETKGDEGGPLVASPPILRAVARLRPAASDKRAYGHVHLLAGSQRYPGAAVMAARAAVRAGAGLTTVWIAETVGSALAGAVPEAMWRLVPVDAEGCHRSETAEVLAAALGARDVLLVGPGLEACAAHAALVDRLVETVARPLVLDAGALHADLAEALARRPREFAPVVLTPHAGEFARIGGGAPLEAFARQTGAVVILKGPVTRLAAPTRFALAPVGNPVLARGGSGDLLAGMVAARLAAGAGDAWRAALEAVVWHGAAADALARARGEVAVATTELLDHLAPVLREAAS